MDFAPMYLDDFTMDQLTTEIGKRLQQHERRRSALVRTGPQRFSPRAELGGGLPGQTSFANLRR